MPRSSKNVYLLADLKDFSQYPLLRGNAYVYLDNVYQGECEIAPDFAAETYSIPVGKDKDIAISRREVKDLTSKKVLGSSVKVVKCVEITVKNNNISDSNTGVCVHLNNVDNASDFVIRNNNIAGDTSPFRFVGDEKLRAKVIKER
jgi:hypothetical protein